MRVIAGIHKGRPLKAVPGKTTRPTTDKIKEAVFQVIGPFFQGGTCLDLFAGSGSLGIEAVSRGMDYAVFVDKHPQALHTIRANVTSLKMEDNADVHRADAFRAIQAASKQGLQFMLIFLDPPYRKVSYEILLEKIVDLHLLKEGGIICCEHDISEKLPQNPDGLTVMKQKHYGTTSGITIYRLAAEERTY